MCGRYVQISQIEVVEKRFNAEMVPGAELPYNPNVTPGEGAPVITSDAPHSIQLFNFGMTPSWSQRNMLLINARSEGDLNPDNDMRYAGGKGIISKPSFRVPIRRQRCLVLADAFMEGPDDRKLSDPYLVYLRKHERPFAFAGIWDCWTDPNTGVARYGFAIITTAANGVTQRIGHSRCPAILTRDQEATWLDSEAELQDITQILEPWPTEHMNAYPISAAIKNSSIKDVRALLPVGERVIPESEYNVSDDLRLDGMRPS